MSDTTPPRTVDVSAGRLTYRDNDGDGPTLLFVHGLLTDGEVWEPTVAALGPDVRCVRPDLPLGAHSVPMSADADQTPLGVARLVREFAEALDLTEVTVVATDTGGAITQLLLADGCDRISRVVLTPSDSFDNFLPRSLRALQYVARVPGVLRLGANGLRLGWLRRYSFHWLSRRPMDPAMTARWAHALLGDRRIGRDVERFLASIDHRRTQAAAETLRGYPHPVLVLWPRTLPYFPFAHAERWVRLLPDARLVEVPDSYTFVCQDQPALLAREIRRFLGRDAAPVRLDAEPG